MQKARPFDHWQVVTGYSECAGDLRGKLRVPGDYQ